MAGFMDTTNQHLIRSDLWSRTLKELLLDDLYAQKFVRTLTDFPDGYTLHIPSIGEAETFDYNEGMAIKYSSMDTGEFLFNFDQYIGSAHSISEKFKRDSYWANEVIGMFVPKEHRAIMERYETRVLSVANSGQTASSLNTINGASHRWVGSGTSQAIAYADFVKAQYALTKAQVPLRNLVAIVDPSVAYTLQTQANVMNLITPQRMGEAIINDGAVSGFKFMFNIFGFDVYISNYLPSSISETINSVSVTNGVANYFFSAAPGDTLPWVGAWRQMPTVYQEFNKDLQQTEYLTICEYGVKLYRPENMITVLTSKSAVPA